MTTRIDVRQLPKDVADLIIGGEELVITSEGEPIATMTRTAFDFDPGTRDVCDNVTVVATTMKLSQAARAALSEQLGSDYVVLDMRSAPKTADVVLVPPGSPQLIGALHETYPKAHVVVAEIEDPELGISYEGPVRRMIDAGAETYLASTTIPRLAAQLDHVVVQQKLQIAGPAQLTIEG
ncbi:hypothetical protein ACWEOE_26955 [Amycolatopsis sp. NPDC004368]